jgi:DNA-directed RNA polymerase subunit RPC12/RpoP
MKVRLAAWLRRVAKLLDPLGESTWWVNLGLPCNVCNVTTPHLHSTIGRLAIAATTVNVTRGQLVGHEARYYRCPQCHHAALWTDGIPEDEEDGPMIWCQTCGHEFPPETGLPS